MRKESVESRINCRTGATGGLPATGAIGGLSASAAPARAGKLPVAPGRSNNSAKLNIAVLAIFALAIAFWPSPAQAMHITEGILPPAWAALWFLVAVPFVAWGLAEVNRRRRDDPQSIVMVALVGSAVFVISCMPVPIPWIGSCSHPCGTGLGALLIGPGPTIVVASIALVLQALFLGHGGLTTLGANIVSMGVVGALGAYLVFHGLRAVRVPLFAAALLAGLASDWATYATTAAGIVERPARQRSAGGHVPLRRDGIRSHAASPGHCRGPVDGHRLPLRLDAASRAAIGPSAPRPAAIVGGRQLMRRLLRIAALVPAKAHPLQRVGFLSGRIAAGAGATAGLSSSGARRRVDKPPVAPNVASTA